MGSERVDAQDRDPASSTGLKVSTASLAVVLVVTARAICRTGRVTFPASSWLQRMLWPASAFGFTFGTPPRPKARGLRLRAGWETRTRIIARPGWGKTLRLLVPIIRDLPGAAMVTSTEPQIFTATVQSRQYRRPLVRWAWLRVFPALRTRREYPVAVVDITAPEVRYAAGYPQVRWNPILGCEDYLTSDRRATALVHATDAGSGETSGGNDAFFRQAAVQVLVAWLHAAALDPHVELSALREWLETSNTAVPASILEVAGGRAEPTAKTNMLTHLDPAAERTTSGVKRYISFALASLTSGDGQRLCGSRRDSQFDMESFILAGGTLYVLAQNERMASARPVLSMFANEVFTAAESAALRLPARRLNEPFIGVIDELRYGVRISSLPYVAASMRKYGIGYIYAAQSSAQEHLRSRAAHRKPDRCNRPAAQRNG